MRKERKKKGGKKEKKCWRHRILNGLPPMTTLKIKEKRSRVAISNNNCDDYVEILPPSSKKTKTNSRKGE